MSGSPTTLDEALKYLRDLINSHGNKKISISDQKEHIQGVIATLEDIKSSSIDKSAEKERLQACYTQQQNELLKLTEENKRLKEEITKLKAQKYDEITSKVPKFNEISCTSSSYAEMARVNRSRPDNTIQRNSHVVIIAPKEENLSKDSNQTIAIAKEKINIKTASQNGLRIEKFQPARGKKCIIKCSSEKDVDKICNILNNDNVITAKKPVKKNPRIMIIGISKDIPAKEIPVLIKAQNPKVENLLEQNPSESMEIIFDKDDRVGTKFAILSTTPALWKLMIDEKRLFIGHKSCPAKNRVSVFQCFKCYRFGHSAEACQNSTSCGNCAGNHETKKCKSPTYKCSNCDRINGYNRGKTNHNSELLNTDHRAFYMRCPQYQRQIAESTKYYHYG